MDFYSVLGVSRDASEREIKDAWRREALKNHPDRLAEMQALALGEPHFASLLLFFGHGSFLDITYVACLQAA